MPDEVTSLSPPSSRPSARPSAMPVQRANYGLPARQAGSVPQPVRPTGRVMDFVPPAVTRPQPAASTEGPAPDSQAAAQPPAVPARPAGLVSAPFAPAAGIPQPQIQTAPAPAAPAAAAAPEAPPKAPSRWRVAHLALLLAGALLLSGGAARWITAGSTSGDAIAVGAVKSNDDKTLKIQFSSPDGAMHYLTADSRQPSLVPGTAVEVAYMQGAPDTTARQVSVVAGARKHGELTAVAGAAMLAGGLLVPLAVRRFQHEDD